LDKDLKLKYKLRFQTQRCRGNVANVKVLYEKSQLCVFFILIYYQIENKYIQNGNFIFYLAFGKIIKNEGGLF
jgi:hypothetical protein